MLVFRQITVCATLIFVAPPLAAQRPDTLPAAMRARIDGVAREVLAATGAPSASIAVVRDGRIAYSNAYGSARLAPALTALPSMRYSIGSISKQFTAAAVLLLAERGTLSLDDKVARWLPDLTRAGEVTVRELLSMTSGYQDYWPQDYVMPPMLKPTSARAIIDGWAKKPLDFDPGTKWQYSNTNYVVAGLIVEQAAGEPLVDFLRSEVFTPLRMQSVLITDDAELGPGDPQRYLRYAGGPPRIAPKEGRGWMFAAGELAMTAADLARWDISVIDQTILKPASYHTQQADVLLRNGAASGYGLGVNVGGRNGHRLISHGGEVSGFTAQNSIYPDDRTAVVVLVNLDATSASATLANRIADVVLDATDHAADDATAQARKIIDGLQHGTLDRTLFTENANAYFTAQAITDFQTTLTACGSSPPVTQSRQSLRGGMRFRAFNIPCGKKVLALTTFTMPGGKLEQFQIAGQ